MQLFFEDMKNILFLYLLLIINQFKQIKLNMKKQLILLFCCVALFATQPAPAAEVGNAPPKTELSVSGIETPCHVFILQAYDATLVNAEIATSVSILKGSSSKPTATPLSPGVSSPRGDAAIPIQAQANLGVNNTHKQISHRARDFVIHFWSFNTDRYWC